MCCWACILRCRRSRAEHRGGATTLDALAVQVLAKNRDTLPVSGRQEYLENLVNRYC
jgi:xylose isomerase